jgi:hypothetical protein
VELGSLLSPAQAHRVLALLHQPPRAIRSAELAELLGTMAQRVDPSEVGDVLDIAARHCAERHTSERHCVELLLELSERLDASGVVRAIDVALAMKSSTCRSDVVCGLIGRLSDAERERVASRLLALGRLTARERRMMANEEPAGERAEAVEAETLSDEALATLLQPLLDEALMRVATTASAPLPTPTPVRRFRATVERERAPVSTPLETLPLLECETDRFVALGRWVDTLPPADLDALLDALPQQVSEMHQADLLGRIARRLPPGRAHTVWSAVMALRQPDARRLAVRQVVLHVAPVLRPALHARWREFLEQASGGHRHELFAGLQVELPLLAALGGDAGVVDVIATIDDIGRSWP